MLDSVVMWGAPALCVAFVYVWWYEFERASKLGKVIGRIFYGLAFVAMGVDFIYAKGKLDQFKNDSGASLAAYQAEADQLTKGWHDVDATKDPAAASACLAKASANLKIVEIKAIESDMIEWRTITIFIAAGGLLMILAAVPPPGKPSSGSSYGNDQ